MTNTILEVDMNNFLNNKRKIEEYTPNKIIMPVLKANAYGTYINENIEILNQFSIVATATVQEAVKIREIGYEKEIFVLNQPTIEEIQTIHKHNITIGLSEREFLKKVSVPIRVHLELETGMNRTGIQESKLEETIEEIKNNPNIIVEGAYTHFSVADTEIDYTNQQIEKFHNMITIIQKEWQLKYIHTSASSGILRVDDKISNTIRPGLLLYGYYPFPDANQMITVKPITKLKTKITYLKEIEAGESISYGRTFTANKKMQIATIPIGYADGLKRAYGKTGYVIIQGKKCKIVGTICMDSCMIDVTGFKVHVGEEVYIWDNEIITLEDIAKELKTISYEILATIGPRVTRIYKKK